MTGYLFGAVVKEGLDEGERRKMKCLENRNWKHIKVKRNAEASITRMRQESPKPLVLDGITF